MATSQLKISDSLSLPLDLGCQAGAIFGIRGSGKTNTAGVLAEELLKANQPIAVVDPTDAWWGLRSSRDGKREGFEVFIFGGSHGDLPLSENDGKAIAEFLVQERVPVVLSLRHLRKGGQRKFVTELCEELYHLKGRSEYRSPLTVFIDEAPLFVPQRVMGEMARTVGAVEDLVARGRNAGFGVVLISQRPATLNADVRSLCDTIITHRVTGPLDRKAFSLWIEENATIEEQDQVLKSLATLKNGEAWVWAPVLGVMKRVTVRLRESFDSSATPKPGQKIAPPKKLAEIDKDKLKGRLAAAVEKAKEEDPKALRQKVKDLEAQLHRVAAAKPVPAAPTKVEVKRVEVPVLKDGQLRRVEQLVEAASGVYDRAEQVTRDLNEARLELANAAIKFQQPVLPAGGAVPAAPAAPARRATAAAPRVAVPVRAPADPASRESLDGPQQRVLDSIAFWESIKVPEPNNSAVAFKAGYSPTSSAYERPRGSLRTNGLISFPKPDHLALMPAGRTAAAFPQSAGTLAELHTSILSVLDGPQQKVLKSLIAAYPDALTNEQLAKASDYSHTSSAYERPRGKLRTFGLVEFRDGGVAATAILFPAKLTTSDSIDR